jgi:hypothetical protein
MGGRLAIVCVFQQSVNKAGGLSKGEAGVCVGIYIYRRRLWGGGFLLLATDFLGTTITITISWTRVSGDSF